MRPQGRPADLVRLSPGLFIGQHAGGGKAEQYLLRGFDADHGTDVGLFWDDMPINLRSHAHGQGYADTHFVIPETIKLLDVRKGPGSKASQVLAHEAHGRAPRQIAPARERNHQIGRAHV